MAFNHIVQHDALENLHRQLAADREQQNILLLVALVLRRRRNRRREREQAALRNVQRQRRPRRWWVKPWVLGRRVHSQYGNLFEELDQECQGDYLSYLRMDRDSFAEILQRVAPRLRKNPR